MTAYLRITAVIFGLVALAHVLRMVMGSPLVLGSWDVPQWLSAVGVIVAGALCAWAVRLLSKG